MSFQTDASSATNILELPDVLLAHLLQHMASGDEGLASAAALSLTCKSLSTLLDNSDVIYRSIHVHKPINSLDHPFWQWLAKRHGRVAGLTATLLLRTESSQPAKAQQPWLCLAQLTNLKQLSLEVAASGDLSSLSALTGLSSPHLHSASVGVGSCSFISLHPLSTLLQLEELVLSDEACSATSLHGLAELSRLKALRLDAPMLGTLEGFSTGLTSLVITNALGLASLAGIEHLQGLQELSMHSSGVTSLHPLAGLDNLHKLLIGGRITSLAGLEGNMCTSLHSLTLERCSRLRQLSGIERLTALQQLEIKSCGVTSLQPVGLVGGLRKLHVKSCSSVQEKVLELPHVQPSVHVRVDQSNVEEVVLAGGIRMKVLVDLTSGFHFNKLHVTPSISHRRGAGGNS